MPERRARGACCSRAAASRSRRRLVGEPGAAHVAVVRAGGDELGQGDLVEHAGLRVGQRLGRDDVGVQMPGKGEPAKPEAGCQRLAGRPGVGNVLGSERLHRPDRLAVVAELPVVVVLDDEPTAANGPVDRRGTPVGRERDTERELVCRGQQHRIGVAQVAGPGAVGVHGQDPEAEPVRGRGRRDGPARPYSSTASVVAPRARRTPAEQTEALREPGTDHEPVGGRPARRGCARGSRRATRAARDGRAGRSSREPRTARHSARGGPRQSIRPAETPPDPATRGAGRSGLRAACGPLAAPSGLSSAVRSTDARARALAGGEPALGDELAVGVGDGVAGDPEIERQHSR